MQDFGGWMWLIIDVAWSRPGGSAVYGIGMWRKRHRDRATKRCATRRPSGCIA